MMNINLKRQTGAGMMNALVMVGILIFIGFIGVKLGSFYVDNRLVQKGLNELDDEPYLTRKSSGQIQEILRKKFSMNDLNIDYRNDIKIDKRSDRVVVDVDYERRTHVISNIDVVVTFTNHYEAVNH